MATNTGYIDFNEGAAPATPAANKGRIYFKADGLAYSKDDAGVETLMSGGATGSVATDAIFDAVGDTVVGSGANTAVKRKNNDGAAVAPTVNEDSGDGYAIGSRWLDTTADLEYVLTDATVAAAVWKRTTLGVWTDYTPTWATSGTPPALGNGALVGRYKALDANTYLVNISWTAGTTTTYGTGTWTFALPATAKNTTNYRQVFAGHMLDAGTDNKLCSGYIDPNTAVVTPIPEGSNTTTSTTPHTWATSDTITLSGILEV